MTNILSLEELGRYETLLRASRTVKEFKTIAREMLLKVSRYQRMADPLAIIASSAQGNVQDDRQIFANNLRKSALKNCPVRMRARVIRRAFRRNNPVFSMPEDWAKKIYPTEPKEEKTPKKWKPKHRTGDPAKRAEAIADKELLLIRSDDRDRKWSVIRDQIYHIVLSEICWQGEQT